MAFISKRKSTWRAQVERRGVRIGMSFPTQAEAVDWAARIEANILKGVKIESESFRKVPREPRYYPTPTLTGLLSREEILAQSSVSEAVCGIYFLISDGVVIYIGKSVDVYGRLAEHRRDKRIFDRVTVIPCELALLSLLESKYILMLQPPLNFSVDGRLVLSHARGSVEMA